MTNLNLLQTVAGFFEPDDQVVVGVSGGADSMALLHALIHSGKALKLTVAHLNHQLRADQSDCDEAFVRAYCAQHHLVCRCQRVDIAALAKQRGISEELCGREARYAFFAQLCPEQGLIATAHTLSDRLETLLFSIARGCSLSGLRSIPERRGRIVRPLLRFTRAQIEAYCNQNHIAYRQDQSNFSTDYARNRIRLQVVPALKQINAGLEPNVARLLHSIEQDEDYLQAQAQAAFEACVDDDGLKPSSILQLHPALQNRVAVLLLKQHRLPVDTVAIQTVLNTARDKKRRNLAENYFVVVQQERLTIEPPPQQPAYFEGEVSAFPSDCFGFHFTLLNQNCYQQFKIVHKNFFHCVVDYDKICGNVKLRQRLPADAIALPKRPTKSLKKLFNESHLPHEVRERLVVFTDGLGVIAVEGFGADRRVLPSEGTRQYLIIEKMGTEYET